MNAKAPGRRLATMRIDARPRCACGNQSAFGSSRCSRCEAGHSTEISTAESIEAAEDRLVAIERRLVALELKMGLSNED